MRVSNVSSKAWWASYVVWTALCASTFVALGGAEDPSRPRGRIAPEQAEIVALEHLAALDAGAYAQFVTVDAAIYRDPVTDRRLWLVLCDDAIPTRLTRAVVVEIDAGSGEVIRTRRPGGVHGAGDGER